MTNNGHASTDRAYKLQVTVTRGDITKARAPVIVAGHYKGVAPLRAVKALDEALGHWISQAGERGMIGGNIGEMFFVPVPRQRRGVTAQYVLLACMGEYGLFNYDDLRYLMMNTTYAVCALGHPCFASVLIGSGVLELQEAVKGLLSGVCDALDHLKADGKTKIKELEIVENDPARYKQILKAFQCFSREKFGSVRVVVEERSIPGGGRGRRSQGANEPVKDDAKAQSFVNRITIERSNGGFHFSALADGAVLPMRQIKVQEFFTEGIAKKLKYTEDDDEQQGFGRLLHTYLFPEDFEHLLRGQNPGLTLILDRDTAALPWEMACFGPRDRGGRQYYFGRDLNLTRQFRSMLSAAPGITPPINKSLRFLVIADPASDDPDLHLEHAKREGEAITNLLKDFKQEYEDHYSFKIEVVSRIGTEQCDPVDILALILNETFDVIHYSGHGRFDKKAPNESGWVINRDCTLSALEIFRARKVPRLVFSNACFSGVTSGGREPSPEQGNRSLAGLAEAFFERGVQNYIGTGWEVRDDVAVPFANTFYEYAMKGEILSHALAASRIAVAGLGPTWGAYQFYGHSNARIAPPQVI